MKIGALLLSMSLMCCAIADAGAAQFAVLLIPESKVQSFKLSNQTRLTPESWPMLKQEVDELSAITEQHFNGVPAGSRETIIFYRAFVNPKESRGGIVIVSGRTEGLALYYETIGDLLRNGYSVYMHDHRGQGYSSRLLEGPGDESRGYVDDFAYYVDDLKTFVDLVQDSRKGSTKPLFMLAHSMGGAIAALLLERKETATPIKGLALITPMFEPWASGDQFGVVEATADRYCDRWATKLPFTIPYLSTRYVDGKDFKELAAEYEAQPTALKSPITRDSTRLAINWRARASTCAGSHCGNGSAKVGGATLRWFNQACAASREARGPAAAAISVPVLLLQGSDDKVVNPGRQVEFCDQMNSASPGRCTGLVVMGGRHGLLLEADAYRHPTLAKTLSFFECTAAGQSRC